MYAGALTILLPRNTLEAEDILMKSARFYLGRTLLALCAVLFISSGFVSCKQDDDSAEQTYELSKIAP